MCLGEVKLTKTIILIDIVEESCLRCCNNDCIHYQGFEQCSINEHLIIYHPKYVSTDAIFSISSSLIFLIDSKEFHIFQRKEMKWFCNSCLTKCNRSGSMKNILTNDDLNEPAAVRKEILYTVITSLPIPAFFDDNMINVYEEQQLHKNLNLPTELLPEKELCEYKCIFSKENITLLRKGLILYTAKAVIDLAEHKGKIILYNPTDSNSIFL